ncbi:MAG: InlB B-repeat-containing protein, partial [Limisphaerales bacterium]
GTAHVLGKFYAGDIGPGSNRVSHVGAALWAGDSGDFDLSVPVHAGDTIDFSAAGRWNNGSTPIDAYIQLTCTNTTTNLLVVASEYGSPLPPVGTNEVLNGTTITCSVAPVTNGLTSYSASGWTLAGQEPASGTTRMFDLTSTATNAVLTWHWQTNFWMDVSVVGNGSVTPLSGFCRKDSMQTFVAIPATGWLFTGWSGDASGTNEALMTMNSPKTVTAHFSDDPDGDGLTNTQEANAGSNPWLVDTDRDGFDDRFEVDHNLNPIVADNWVTDYIHNNGTTFNLFPSNAVLDVAMGQMLLETSGGNATLRLQLLQSADLITWTNTGTQIIWQMPVNGTTRFFRVSSGP